MCPVEDYPVEVVVVVGEIPQDRLYFKIGEVAKIIGVKPYVLRYWETEFAELKPSKTRSQHRQYRRKDVETLMRIKDLLHARRFTIEGARKQLKADSRSRKRAVPSVDVGKLGEIRRGLLDLKTALA